MNNNIFISKDIVTKELRMKNQNQKPFIIWITGLSASGKTTLANELEIELYKKGLKTYLLDGDNLRTGLNKDLRFSKKDREENIRRVAHVSQILCDAGIVVITAFISPFKKDRKHARSLVKNDEFIEVFLNTPLNICEQRDPKGLYKKARKGEIKDFTGIDSIYEKANDAEIILGENSISNNVKLILKYLSKNEIIQF